MTISGIDQASGVGAYLAHAKSDHRSKFRSGVRQKESARSRDSPEAGRLADDQPKTLKRKFDMYATVRGCDRS
jgi:hypothetical protein